MADLRDDTFVSFSVLLSNSSQSVLFGNISLKFLKASLNFFILSLSFLFSVFLLYLLSLYFLGIFSLTLGCDLLCSVTNLLATELLLSNKDLQGKGDTSLVSSTVMSPCILSRMVNLQLPM